jgi:Asp-tRNA(Asn)/Glu-tRNA(Gln) amidotransferase A subunit family amidase
MLDEGLSESEGDYQAALRLQRECKALTTEVFAGIDLLLVPGATGAAPQGLVATGNPAFQRIWTAIGVPCLGFPAEWQADGLPLGLQIIAAPDTDRQLLANAVLIVALGEPKET